MNKKKKVALVPKLRFSMFRTSGEWDICLLKDLASRITVRNQDNLIDRVLTNSAVDGVVDQRDYFDREVANHNNLENYFVVSKGDYVYNPRISATAPVGPVSKNKVCKGVMSPLYTVFRFKNNNDFYEQYFKTNLWHKYLKSISNTGARHDRMSISNDGFMDMPIALPSLKEQQKIADCLSSLDDLISTEKQKIGNLKSYKKGLIQQLFPAEGKRIPKLRFPGFTGAWEQRKLGELMDVGSVKRIHQSDWTNSGIRFLRARDIVSATKGEESTDYLYIAQEKYDEYSTISGKVKKGDLLVTGVGSIGVPMLIDTEEPIFYKDGNIIWFKNENEFFDGKFLYYSFIGRNIQQFIRDVAGIGTVGTYTIENGKKTPIQFPSLVEQKKIGSFFANLDRLITLHQRKLEALNIHKKGLMQGLFPAIEKINI